MNNNIDIEQGVSCLFVTFDQYGVPERFEYLTGNVTTNFLDSSFIHYLGAHKYEPGYVPDLHVCRYDFSNELLNKKHLDGFYTDPRALKEFIDQHHLIPEYDFPLRKVYAIDYALEGVDDSFDLETLGEYISPYNKIQDGVTDDMDQCMEKFRKLDESFPDRLKSIETAQGVLLFPDIDNIKPRMHSMLQYIADNFFNPQADQIKYVRFYDIDSPTEEQTRIANQSGYMFSLRDGSFLPEKALWHPTVSVKKETDRDCQYDLIPTYEAFRNFTEDHNLTISPRNDQIFNLLFIAEMGCPAFFQTNIQYVDFTHMEEFRELDNRLEKAKREEPKNIALFYSTQNQQQLLARDILRDQYNVVVPEVKLTGPSTRTRKKMKMRLK